MTVSKLSPVKYKAIERELRVLDLRRSGMSYSQISQVMNISMPVVSKLLRRAFKRHMEQHEELASEVIEFEKARLDELYMTLYHDTIRKIDGEAVLATHTRRARNIEVMLKIMERRSKLLGLDQPAKSQILSVGVDLGTFSDEELKAEFEKLGLQESLFIDHSKAKLPGEVESH